MENITFTPNNNFIPPVIIESLHLKNGDSLSFRKLGSGYYFEKATPHNYSDASDKEYSMLAEQTFAEEWLSEEDEKAFKNL